MKPYLPLTFALFLSMVACNNSTTKVETPATETKTETAVVEKKEPIVDLVKVKELEKDFTKKTDEFSNTGLTWYQHKDAPKYVDQNGIYCYFKTENGKPASLRLSIQYAADDWLFFKKVLFSVDSVAYEYIPNKTETDHADGKIWEYCDQSLTEDDKKLIYALANAKSAKMKFVGRQYFDVKDITPEQIATIKKTLEFYNAMGGNF